ncbi:carbohydrate binding domain-containing protein, partial [Paenibacillus sp. SI8]|uniref:carbohydrate binding domain-containing protein n=1 Tax=Paenibacillus sp. SI8 TaxID=3163026 RepID=UPI0034667320
NVSQINPPSDGDAFYSTGGYNSAYGKDFLAWYQGVLENHLSVIAAAAHSNFDSVFGVRIGAKISGIHWQYNNPSAPHSAENAAGYYNYSTLIQKFKDNNLDLTFTALEMSDDGSSPNYSMPSSLVDQISSIANSKGVRLNGENALPTGNFQKVEEKITRWNYNGFTLLRLANLVNGDGSASGNMSGYKQFVISHSKPDTDHTVTIYYKKGFSTPFVNYKPAGGSWTTGTGTKLNDASGFPGYATVTLNIGAATQLEAAFNDGNGTVDNNNNSNYTFGAGTWTYTPGTSGAAGTIVSGTPVVDGNKVTVYYKKGFSTPFIHYRPANGTWTTSPGKAIPDAEAAFTGYGKITIDIGTASQLEAVFNNGSNTWDNNNTKNYFFNVGSWIYTPGPNGAPGTISPVTEIDLLPPSVPTNVAVSGKTGSSISLSWTASTDNVGVTGYEIWRDGAKVGTSTTTSFTNTGLAADTSYSYTVKAYDAANNISDPSTAVSAKTENVPTGSVTVYYKRGFATPFIHYRPAGGTWTTAPGAAMPVAEAAYPGYNKVTIDIGTATQLEAVFNNGSGTWDNNSSKNYFFNAGIWTYTPGANGAAGTITQGTPPDNQDHFVTVYYKRGYSTPFIHYRPAGGTWTTSPGAAMPASELSGYSKIKINIGPATQLEAVFNNGSGTWDNNAGKNYLFNIGSWTYTPGLNGSPGTITPGPIIEQEKPTKPTNLASTGKTDSTVTLSWTASTDNVGVTGYEIWRDGVKVGTSATTSFTNSGLSASTTYSFTVKAFDASGNISDASDAVSVKTEPVTGSTVTIYYQKGYSTPFIHYRPAGGTWTTAPGKAIPDATESGFAVITINIGSAAQLEADFNNGSNTWDNNNSKNYLFNPGTWTYTPGANGAPGTITSRGIDLTPPSTPTNVVSTGKTDTTVSLSWTASTDDVGVTGYEIWRDGVKVDTTTTTSYTNTGLTKSTTYSYSVKAYDASGKTSESSTAVSVKTDEGTNFPVTTDWSKQSIYFIMTDRFVNGDTSNDNAGGFNSDKNDPTKWHGGDFQGIINNLDYIKNMGFTAIWITPVTAQKSQFAYHGYHTYDFYSIDGHLGTMDKFKELVSTAHSKNIAIMLDVVPNHTGDFQPGSFAKAPFDKFDWYHHNGNINDIDYGNATTAPNTFKIENGEVAGLDDLNQENPATAAELKNWIQWLINESKVDGLRVDTAKHMPKWFLKDFDTAANTFTIAEVFNGDPNTIGDYSNFADAVLDFPMYYTIRDVFGHDASMTNIKDRYAQDNKYRDTRFNGTFLDNHDLNRFLNEASGRPGNGADKWPQLKAALGFMLTSRGIPILYQGTELGYSGGHDPANREDVVPNANNELYKYIAKVNAVRNSHPALQNGTQKEKWVDNNFYSFQRSKDGDEAIVLINNSWNSETRTIGGYENFSNGTSLTNQLGSDTVQINGGSITVTLEPKEVKIFTKASTTPVDTQKPTAPTSVAGTPSSSSVSLQWTASTDNVKVTGYDIYRNGVKVGTSATASFTDSGLLPETPYKYTVKAFDAASNVSDASAEVTVTTLKTTVLDTEKPTAPTNVTGTPSFASVALQWTASTDNVLVTGYDIYRNGAKVGSSAVPSFSDAGLTPETTYIYSVKAFDAANNFSDPSVLATVATTKKPVDTGTSKAYATNPTFGKRVSAPITIDGVNNGEWTDANLIAIDAANDDPRTLGSNWSTHETPMDLTHLWATWDNDNLYLAWQYVDVTDVIDPNNAGSSAGTPIRSMDMPQTIAIDTIPGAGAALDMWKKNGNKPIWGGTELPDYQFNIASKMFHSGYISKAVNGVFPVDDAGVNYKTGAAAGIVVKFAPGNAATSLWGAKDADDANTPSKLVNFLTLGHNVQRDTFYEAKIPLSAIGNPNIELNGIGVKLHQGEFSPVDTIPNDAATSDTPGVSESNSPKEWGDVDLLTSNFARIGK